MPPVPYQPEAGDLKTISTGLLLIAHIIMQWDTTQLWLPPPEVHYNFVVRKNTPLSAWL